MGVAAACHVHYLEQKQLARVQQWVGGVAIVYCTAPHTNVPSNTGHSYMEMRTSILKSGFRLPQSLGDKNILLGTHELQNKAERKSQSQMSMILFETSWNE